MQQPGLTVRYADDVLYVAGELDVASAPSLREALIGLLDREEVSDLTLDASGVAFCDSSGLAVLLMGARRWASTGRRLILRRTSPALRRVIDLAGAARAFEFAD